MKPLNLANGGLEKCIYPIYVEMFVDAITDLLLLDKIDEKVATLQVGEEVSFKLPDGTSADIELLSTIIEPTDNQNGKIEVKISHLMSFIFQIVFSNEEDNPGFIHEIYFTETDQELEPGEVVNVTDPSKSPDFWMMLEALGIEWE
jgi:hypothetical protein